MPYGKIRVKSSSEYVIEVNDNGETISFDTTDTGLTSRLCVMYESIDKLTNDFTAQAAAIDARTSDTPLHKVPIPAADDGESMDRVILTQNQLDGARLIDNYYAQARVVLDGFLGAGACQKIFGDKNYLTMFDDLIKQLQPHFEKMGVNVEDITHSAAKKHAPNRQARRAMK